MISDVICENITSDSSNLTVSVGSLAYLTTINYTCLEGHYFDDNTTVHISMCNANEEWTIPATEDQICSRKLLTLKTSALASQSIGHVNVRKCGLIDFIYLPVGLQCCCVGVKQPIRIV